MAASDSFRFPGCNFIKGQAPTKTFSVNCTNFLRTFFDRRPSDDCDFAAKSRRNCLATKLYLIFT